MQKWQQAIFYMTHLSFSWFDGTQVESQQEQDQLTIRIDGTHLYSSVIRDLVNQTLSLTFSGCGNTELQTLQLAFHSSMYHLFTRYPESRSVQVEFSDYPENILTSLISLLTSKGLLRKTEDDQQVCERALWWQDSFLWLNPGISQTYPKRYTMTNGKRHPVRQSMPDGVNIYQFFSPQINKTFSMRKIDIEKDLETFHAWMNQERVDFFWEESGDIEAHRKFLENALSDPKVLPMIGFFDDEPVGYFESYWVKEDRLAPYCDGRDYDRGMHMLIGNESFLGRDFSDVWLHSVVHFSMLADVRTNRLLGEPRNDNKRLLKRLHDFNFYREKDFDFPHKRAALIAISRETFFDQA